MLNTFIFIAIILLAGFAILFYSLYKRLKIVEQKPLEDKSMLLLSQNISELQRSINESLSQLNKELGSVKEVSHQMQSLQDFFRSPKQRGSIGEQVLKDLLEQYFSQHHFALQYKFKSGERVDAVLKTREGIIPIDSKAPLENFQKIVQAKSEDEKTEALKLFVRDVKKHINDISKKYIVPQEGTVDFAVMYIPSEAVYYEIIQSSEELDEYAKNKMVYFVSPNSFYYFLRIIMIGMRGQEIQENTKQILKVLLAVSKDTEKLGTVLEIVTTHINHAKAAIDRVNNEYMKLTGKVDQVKLLK